MSTNVAQTLKERERDLANVESHGAFSHPSGLTFAEAAKSADRLADRYLPGKWSWAPAKPSFDW